MKHILELPELVTRKILKYVIDTGVANYDVGCQFEYLDICHLWRELAIPIAFRKLTILEHPTKYLDIEDDADSSSLAELIVGTVELFELTSCQRFVRELVIDLCNMDISFDIVVVPLLKALDMDYRGTESPFPQEMSNVVAKFVLNYPNITDLTVLLPSGGQNAMNLCSDFISAYGEQITKLNCHINAPLDLAHFPTRLTHLVLKLDYENVVSFPTPKINPAPLRRLGVLAMGRALSWRDIFIDDEPMVFPNVSYLDISNRNPPATADIDRKDAIPEFPRLEELRLDIYGRTKLRLPKLPGSHLRKIDIRSNLDGFYKISQMASSKSIDYLVVTIMGDAMVDMKEFYKATNQMFGELENRCETHVSINDLSIELDPQFLVWKNVTRLSVWTLTNRTLIAMINQLPRLTSILVEDLCFTVSNSDVGELTKEPKLEEISITRYQIIEPMELACQYMLGLMKSLTKLRYVQMNEDFGLFVQKTIVESSPQYQHLNDLDWVLF